MPYISQEQRDNLQPQMLPPGYASTGGELNYIFTREINQFLAMRSIIAGRLRYEDFNTVIGALEACKLELYRRMVAPHEDQAIQRNGDCYTP